MDLYEIIDPSFRSFILPNATLDTLGTGFRWLEGPVWFADHNCLVFSLNLLASPNRFPLAFKPFRKNPVAAF